MQTLIYSVFFALIVTFTEEVLFNRPQSYFLTFLLDRRGENLLPGLASTIAALFFLIMLAWLCYSLSRKARLLLLPLLILPVIVETAYQHVFLRWLSVLDIKTALASPPGLWSAAFSLYFSPSMGILVVVYLLLLFGPGRTHPVQITFPATTLAVCLLLIGGSQAAGFSTNWGTSIPHFYYTAVEWGFSDTKPLIREKLSYTSPTRPTNNIVLIIDESIRSDHLRVNGYTRPTTPYLDKLAATPGLVHNWGTAVSGATCSQLSNAMLLSGIQPDPTHPRDAQVLAHQYPTLFDYARAMGYRTYYLDAQTDYLWNGQGLEDAMRLTGWMNTRDLGTDLARDQRAAEWIRAQVNQSTGNLIVLNKKGVHFIYEDSYPPDQAIWEPLPRDYHAQPDLAINPYDNGIRYNVDAFFARLLPDAPHNPYPTLYLYTSDHGQTLFEQGTDWLHCNYTRMEASVPLLVIGQLAHEPDVSFPASHANILPTLLDLMGVPNEVRTHPYAPSLLYAEPNGTPDRYYISGDGQVIAFDQ